MVWGKGHEVSGAIGIGEDGVGDEFSEDGGWNLFGGLQVLDLEYEGLFHDDIVVQRGGFRYEQARGSWTVELGYGYTDYSLDYEPFVALGGVAADLTEETHQVGVGLGYRFSESLETELSLNYYEGFADYRSIWIAEYYRQLFSFPGSGYFEPDPSGFSVSSVWYWSPVVGTRIGLDLSYAENTIAPGWTFGSPANDLLVNYSGSLRWEQAINTKLKTELMFSMSDVTDRDVRYNLQSSWRWAVTDRLTVGAEFGGTIEDPEFEALYGGLSLTNEVTPNLSLVISGRIYDDTGEIESSGFNASAPGLESLEVGVSALYEVGGHAFRLGVSHYVTDYEEPDLGNEFFANLYNDRDWWLVRAAYSYEF